MAKSPLASAALTLLAGGVAVAFAGPWWIERWRELATRCFAGQADLEEALGVAALGLAAPLGAAVVVGALSGFLQVGPLFTLRPIVPDLSRLDPARGLQKRFSGPELLARLAPIGLVVVVGALAVAALREGVGLLGRTELAPDAALAAVALVGGAFFWRACAALALGGAIALTYRRYRYWLDQHMSRRELLREQRELEGEPGARRARERARRDLGVAPTLAEALSRAVLVVHGADLAVLVGWEDRQAAPTVLFVARGAGVEAAIAIPRAADPVLAAELAALRPGAAAPRGTWPRLAAWIAKGDA